MNLPQNNFTYAWNFGFKRIESDSMSCLPAMFLKWIEHSQMWHLETRHLIRNWKTAINYTGAIVISPFRPLMDIVTIYKYIINWKLICWEIESVGGNMAWWNTRQKRYRRMKDWALGWNKIIWSWLKLECVRNCKGVLSKSINFDTTSFLTTFSERWEANCEN